jgi:hypothetical protein
VLSEDVGALAFYSGVAVLDPVGLTDLRVARSRSPEDLASVVFDFDPDIVIFRGIEGSVEPFGGTGGHGAIGRFGKGAILQDPRFSKYQYVGFGPAGDPIYRWHFWARREFPDPGRILSYSNEPIGW